MYSRPEGRCGKGYIANKKIAQTMVRTQERKSKLGLSTAAPSRLQKLLPQIGLWLAQESSSLLEILAITGVCFGQPTVISGLHGWQCFPEWSAGPSGGLPPGKLNIFQFEEDASEVVMAQRLTTQASFFAPVFEPLFVQFFYLLYSLSHIFPQVYYT